MEIDDGTLTQRAEQIMGKVFNLYKSCKDDGTWDQESSNHQQIVAL